jgi:hypothetical protein
MKHRSGISGFLISENPCSSVTPNTWDQQACLEGALKHSQAWRCKACGQINGIYNIQCWNCWNQLIRGNPSLPAGGGGPSAAAKPL